MPRNNFYEEDTQEKKKMFKEECPVCGERQFYKEPKRRRCDDYYDSPEMCYPPCPEWLKCPPPWYWCKPEPEKECKRERCDRKDDRCDRKDDRCDRKDDRCDRKDDCCDRRDDCCERKEDCCKKEKGCDIEAYGYVYSLTSTAVSILANSDVLFTNNGPLDCITHTPNTAQIFIRKSGNYQVFYALSTTVGVGATLSLAVNGAVNPATTIALPVSVGHIAGKVILPLRAGDFLTLRNSSIVTVTLAVAPAIGAQLTLERLDDIDFNNF